MAFRQNPLRPLPQGIGFWPNTPTPSGYYNLWRGEERNAVQRWLEPQGVNSDFRKSDPPPRRELDTRRRSNNEPNWDAWNEWADAKIANALAVERKIVLEVIAEEINSAVNEAHDHLADELKSLRIEHTQL
ncbi:hypothetical protein J2R71_010343, partial [Bradyrhizobium japonicum]